MNTDSNLTSQGERRTLRHDGTSPTDDSPTDIIERITKRVNPLVEAYLEIMHCLPLKSSIHEWVEIACGLPRESALLVLRCRVGKAIGQVPLRCREIFFRWWYHYLEAERLRALLSQSIAAKQRQQARKLATEARAHLDEMDKIGDSECYRRAVVIIDAAMTGKGGRQRGTSAR